MLLTLRATRLIAFPTILVALGTIAGCAGLESGSLADEDRVKAVAESFGVQWTGLAVSKAGRRFVSSPNWHDGHYWSVAELKPDGSPAPYPDQFWNRFDERLGIPPGDQFVCVQSVHIDSSDRLWVLDPASPKFAGVIPGGAKLVQFDLATDRAARIIHFDDAIAPKNSYLNDVRIDVARDTAYITDSGLGAIVVVDLQTGKARRLLADDPRTKAEDIVPVIEGRELRYSTGPETGQVPKINADGIAISSDGQWLYWQALTARTLYRIPTDVLRDPTSSDERISAAVKSLGPSVMTDGMEIDSRGTLYFTALEKGSIMTRTPDGLMQTIARDPRIIWPDSFAFGSDGSLYFTTSQINRTSRFSPRGTMPASPYFVFRLPAGW
ncbi:MAG: SMP-30/gluconolactonase/LRE family protein [Phycisphaeraceae bacterium]|nr:SMP-30/gluconolactonase/LRE family protein [Phycisphaeraceae bacterium]